jgi:flagellar hook-basal body complex protein FliE
MVGVNHVAGAVSGALAATNFTTPPASPFSGVFRGMVEQASDLEGKAHAAVTGLLSGQGVEVHDAMIATQKADMAFELALQVRNKVVGAYQQMMQMQF